MARTLEERLDPERLLPGALSVVAVALSYAPSAGHAPPGARDPSCAPPLSGRVSIYARGRDYHAALIQRLEILRRELRQRHPGVGARVCADTSPFLERYWAREAGLGWIGKNTNLIVEGIGSWVFLGALLCDLPLATAGAAESDRCGACRRCLDACPTGAFDRAWLLDARRCVAYLTVEHEGEVPPALARAMGDRVFGCDDCQTACPWNASPVWIERLPLERLARLSQEDFDRLAGGRALKRAGRARLRRSALIALGNSDDPAAAEPLREALQDPDPVLRRQAAASLERLERAPTREG
jgi:epoxyqueuosine reductase